MRLPIFYVVLFSVGLLSVILSAVLVYYNVFYLDRDGKPSAPPIGSRNPPRYESRGVNLFRNLEGKNTMVGYRGYVRSLDPATRSVQISWPRESNSSYSVAVPTDTTFLFAGQDAVALINSVQGDITKIDSQLSFDDIRPGDFIQLSLMGNGELYVYRSKQ